MLADTLMTSFLRGLLLLTAFLPLSAGTIHYGGQGDLLPFHPYYSGLGGTATGANLVGSSISDLATSCAWQVTGPVSGGCTTSDGLSVSLNGTTAINSFIITNGTGRSLPELIFQVYFWIDPQQFLSGTTSDGSNGSFEVNYDPYTVGPNGPVFPQSPLYGLAEIFFSNGGLSAGAVATIQDPINFPIDAPEPAGWLLVLAGLFAAAAMAARSPRLVV